MKGKKTTKFFGLATVFIFAVVFLSSQVFASAKPEVKQGEILDNGIVIKNGTYLSSAFKTEFEFNLAGFAWPGETKEEVKISLRFYNDSGWSKWYSSESEDYFAKDSWYYNTEPILANQASKIQYKLETLSEVKEVKLIYVSTYKENIFKKWDIFDLFFSEALAGSELNIISRPDWEADED